MSLVKKDEAESSGENSNISYHVKSRLEGLAVMIENGDKKGLSLNTSGVKAIFSGANTASAETAANMLSDMLHLSLQYVDISGLYKKYCGEAENYLEQLLSAAQASHSIVIFDRLDDIFGHDVQVTTEHGRHVQLDVNYFLKTLAKFQMPAIICTRAYHRLDVAIMRQFACVIDLDDGVYPVRRQALA